ncbi:MAG: zf-HC2 domain-containing protein [Spirochaetaceae bacterium]|jgi:hypothetical protein|nr:zf-HC2 domain-containing protein [Spirochaetaceae bacterium]
MCPEKQILSVYFDGELPERFKEKITKHLASCGRCREALDAFGGLSRALSMGASGDALCAPSLAAQRRVWDTLSVENFAAVGRRRGALRRRFPEDALLRRSVRIPLPFAAAAGLVIVFAAAVLGYEVSGLADAPEGLKAGVLARYVDDEEADSLYYEGVYSEGREFGSTIQASNMDDVLRYVENNSSDIVSMRLPESKNFRRFGEPKLVNASDYPRRRMGQ